MRTLAALAILLLVAACQAPPPEMSEAEIAQWEEEVRQEIQTRSDAFTEAILQGDGQAAASYWTSDALLLEPGIRVEGSELPGFFAEFFSTGAVTLFDTREWEMFVHEDAVYSIGEYEETYDLEGMEPFTVEMYYFMRWEKEEGEWKMDRLLSGPRDAPPEG